MDLETMLAMHKKIELHETYSECCSETIARQVSSNNSVQNKRCNTELNTLPVKCRLSRSIDAMSKWENHTRRVDKSWLTEPDLHCKSQRITGAMSTKHGRQNNKSNAKMKDWHGWWSSSVVQRLLHIGSYSIWRQNSRRSVVLVFSNVGPAWLLTTSWGKFFKTRVTSPCSCLSMHVAVALTCVTLIDIDNTSSICMVRSLFLFEFCWCAL